MAPSDRPRIVDAFRGTADVAFVELLRGVLPSLRQESRPVTAVLVGARDAAGALAAPVIRDVASTHPHVAVLALCEVGVLHTQDLRYLASAGVHEIVFRGVNDTGAALRALLESAVQECAADVVMARLAPMLPSRVHGYAELCLARPQDARTVSAAARLMGLHRKTLVNQCARERLPGPQELMGWFRLMLVAHFLTTTARTVETIAVAHEWASATALRNMSRRYLGARPTEIRRGGGLTFVLDRFRQRLEHVRRAGEHTAIGEPDEP